MFTLATDRLVLRDFASGDFDAFFATTNDPDYQQFYAERETMEAHWRQIFERILDSSAAPERMMYQLAICLPTGKLVGTCGVRIEDAEHKQASFGCAIARPFWGQGLAYEASHCLIDFGFSSLPIHRLYAETISENRNARRLEERLGMRLEGEFRENRFFRGRWWHTVIYAVLKDEWELDQSK
ncbi:MAG: GNAT family N-acetyltransferase [Chloroflexi bacterium]|nr:GNAT family N-acetyltransferase [Chloroflexota bacterium]